MPFHSYSLLMLLTDFSYGAPAASAPAAVSVFGCSREFPSPCPSLKTHQCRTHRLASCSTARSNALQHYHAFSANSVQNSFIRFFKVPLIEVTCILLFYLDTKQQEIILNQSWIYYDSQYSAALTGNTVYPRLI